MSSTRTVTFTASKYDKYARKIIEAMEEMETQMIATALLVTLRCSHAAEGTACKSCILEAIRQARLDEANWWNDLRDQPKSEHMRAAIGRIMMLEGEKK